MAGVWHVILGVDGCPGGWVVAAVEGRTLRWHLAPDAAGVLGLLAETGAAAAGVDIPIGLSPDSPRECDSAARRLLGRAGGPSVFPAPVRAVLDATSYAEACARSRAAHVHGRAVSLQTWHLVPKIREWEAAAVDAFRVVEVHPEVSFRLLAARQLDPKKRQSGREARQAVLASFLDWSPPPRPARADDGLDAAVCAWSADRWVRGKAVVLPPDPPRDPRGRPMRIVA